MFFSDLHVDLLSRGLLQPGESLVSKTVGTYKPWWGFGFINRQYLVLATDRRLILLDHRAGFFGLISPQHLFAVDSLPWSQVQEAKVKGLFNKSIKIAGHGERGAVKLPLKLPKAPFGPTLAMKNNVAGAQGVAHVFAHASQAPALAPQSYGGHALPMQNAPGYVSHPPPSQQQQQQLMMSAAHAPPHASWGGPRSHG